MAQNIDDAVGAIGGLLRGRNREKSEDKQGSGVKVETIVQPDGNNISQASGTSYLGAVTLNVMKNGGVTVALDRDRNGTKETVVTSLNGLLTVSNSENAARPAVPIQNPQLAAALAEFGASAVRDKQVTPVEFNGVAAIANDAADAVPRPATPAAPTPAPRGRRTP